MEKPTLYVEDPRVLLKLQRSLDGECDQLTKRVGKELYLKVKEVTGKRFFSLPVLRKMGYPYSRKFPKDFLLDDRVINFQTGKLNRSIRWTYSRGKNTKTISVWSNDPKASRLIRGSEHMRERNFFQLAYERAQPRIKYWEKKFLEGE